VSLYFYNNILTSKYPEDRQTVLALVVI